MRGPDPERRVRKHICEDAIPICHFWDGNKCRVDADEERCAEAYDSEEYHSWDYYKDECLEQLEERMSEQKDICEVTECEYCTDQLPLGCRVGADKAECARYMAESGKIGWEFYARECAKKMSENIEWLQAEGVVPG